MTWEMVGQDVPPGENPTDELTGQAAADAIQQGLLALTTSAGLRLEVKTLHARRFNGRAIVVVRFTNGQSATLRIAIDRLQEFRDACDRVLTAGPNGTDMRPTEP